MPSAEPDFPRPVRTPRTNRCDGPRPSRAKAAALSCRFLRPVTGLAADQDGPCSVGPLRPT